jgi:hypothetical protein
MSTKSRQPKIGTSDTEIREALRAAKRRDPIATKISAVRYSPAADTVSVTLSTGASLTVPRCEITGFSGASPRAMRDIEITPGGEGLWSDQCDDGVLLEQLLILAAGSATLGTIGARINAAKTSAARSSASRANGAKGGRPKKHVV